MIRCPRCGRFASQTHDEELQRAVKFLAAELKHGPRKIHDLRQTLTARGEFISDECLFQAAGYLELDENAEGALAASPFQIDDLDTILENLVGQQETSPSISDLLPSTPDQTVETEPLGPPDFELNISSIDGEVTGAVRITNSCGGCGRPLLDYHFTIRERREARRFESTLEEALGKKRTRHILDTSADWFEDLTPEEQQKTEKLWEYSHGLLLEVKQADRVAKIDRADGATYHGFDLTYVVTCKCGGYRFEGHFQDSVPVAEMRSLLTKSEVDDYNLKSVLRAQGTHAADPNENKR